MHAAHEITRGALILAVFLGLILWLVFHTIRNAESRSRMAGKWVLTFLLVTLIAASYDLLGPWAPFLIALCGVILSFMCGT